MPTGHKYGGRKKGTPNSITKELREMISGILKNEWKNIPKLLKKLSPKDRINAILKITQYAVPKINSVNAEIDPPPDWQNKFESMSTSNKQKELKNIMNLKKDKQKRNK